MKQRSRILSILFAVAILALPAWKFVYPRWIERLVTLDERLAQRRATLTELKELQGDVERDAEKYRTLLSRIGAFDIDRVSVNARDRLNELVERHQLQAENIAPSPPREDKKKGFKSTTVSVSAVGALESIIGFLKDASELPYLMRIGNVSMYPASAGRGERVASRMNIRVPIELRALPAQAKIVGRVEEKDLLPPPSVVRHEGRNYAVIWSGTPFSQKLPLPPLKAVADKSPGIKQGQEHSLRGSATGGDGNYTFTWSGPGVLEPSNSVTKLDTANLPLGEHEYTLAVADGTGQASTTTVKLNVKERVVQTAKKTDIPPPPPPDPNWPDGAQKQLVMMLGNSEPASDELMVLDRRSNQTSYYRAGDEFDGGKLVFVHQTGGLVHKKNEFYVYPIGSPLDKEMPVTTAEQFPELQRAASIKQSEPAVNPPVDQGVGIGLSAPGVGTVMAPARGGETGEVLGPPLGVEHPAAAGQPQSLPASADADAAQAQPENDRRTRPPRTGRRQRNTPK